MIRTDDGREVRLTTNTPDDIVIENIKSSVGRFLPELRPHQLQDQVIALVGGGPSLEFTKDDLIEKYESGVKLVSMNGTHDWLLDNGMRPSAHIQVDARDFNARFVENWQEKTKYLMASQCHPQVFENLDGADTYLFHCEGGGTKDFLDEYYDGKYLSVAGGSTVMLRAIPLMRMLGFKRMEIYGFDSCLMNNGHHAYEQTENDKGAITTFELNGKEFTCFAWMYVQAKEFMDLIRAIGDEIELLVHGDGLIAHILKTSAEKLEVK